MKPAIQRLERPSNPAAAVFYCVMIALIIGYFGSYLFTHMGAGVASDTNRDAGGHSVFMNSALNYYVMHGVTIAGSGRVRGELGDVENVSASIKLPLTIWFFVPAFALLIAGYISGRSRNVAGRWGAIVPAVIGGVIYAAILAIASKYIHADVNSTALPEINGTSFNPPKILFHPLASSAFFVPLVFGVIFTYLGALISIRGVTRNEIFGKWWACAKSALLMVVVVGILIAGAAEILYIRQASKHPEDGSVAKFTQALPSVAGIGYILANGATVNGVVESKLSGTDFGGRPFAIQANMYKGVIRDDDQKKSRDPFPPAGYILSAIVGFSLLLAGWIAVRMGSRDGSIPTAVRILIFQVLYVAILMQACRVAWTSITRAGGMVSELSVFIRPEFSLQMLYAMVAAFILVVIGAYAASGMRVGANR